MLRFFISQASGVPQDPFFQRDGASPHYVSVVREYLDQKFESRWIGRAGSVAWPPRSLDVSTCDFFLRANIKNRILTSLPATFAVMMARIQAAVAFISENTL